MEKNDVECCADCIHLMYEPPCSSQPYEEFWCDHDIWGGLKDINDLYRKVTCIHFERKDNENK